MILDAADGTVIRTLFTANEGRHLGSVSLSPDGETAYVDDERFGGRARILAAPTAGGPAKIIGRGWSPSVSPDGTRLAFVGQGPDKEGDPSLIVVRTLASGHERSWRREEGDHIGGMYFAGWLPDSRRFLFGGIGADPPGSISGMIDVREPGNVLRRSKIGPLYGSGPVHGGRWGAWESAAPRAHSDLVVAAKMGTGGDSPTRLELVDPSTLRRTGILKRTNKDLWDLDFDASGRHLLAVGRPWQRWRSSARLYRWHGGKLIRLANGITSAAW